MKKTISLPESMKFFEMNLWSGDNSSFYPVKYEGKWRLMRTLLGMGSKDKKPYHYNFFHDEMSVEEAVKNFQEHLDNV